MGYISVNEENIESEHICMKRLAQTPFKTAIICYAVTVCIFLVIALWGRFGLITGDEMGYSILNFYLIMPLTSMIVGLVVGLKRIYLKWLYPVLVGILGFLIPYFVFASHHEIALFFSFIPAMAGVSTGTLIAVLRRKRMRK